MAFIDILKRIFPSLSDLLAEKDAEISLLRGLLAKETEAHRQCASVLVNICLQEPPKEAPELATDKPIRIARRRMSWWEYRSRYEQQNSAVMRTAAAIDKAGAEDAV